MSRCAAVDFNRRSNINISQRNGDFAGHSSSILCNNSFSLSNSSKVCFDEERREKLSRIEKRGRYIGSLHAIDQIEQISVLVPPQMSRDELMTIAEHWVTKNT